jgi:hypothetical protein
MQQAKRKICVVTGSRAEYGLLYWLMKEIQGDSTLELQVIVTGMHLSPEFGLTWKQIEQDGFIIDRKVEMLLSWIPRSASVNLSDWALSVLPMHWNVCSRIYWRF